MEELVKLLSADLAYISHEITAEIIYIHVKSARKSAECPYCKHEGIKVHSFYRRNFRDLPMQGKKVEIVLNNLKYFCKNPECKHKSFAEVFDCFPFKGKRSKRLTETIIELSLNVSSVTASKLLKNGMADVGKSTICNLLKKGRKNQQESNS